MNLEKLSAAGFTIESTGGGCTALVRRFHHDGHTWEVLITDELNAPTDLDKPFYDIVVSCELDQSGSDNDHYRHSLRGADTVLHAVCETILSTMSNTIDYTLSEVWPDWTDHVK